MIIQGKVWGNTSPIFEKNNVEVHYLNINKGGFCSTHHHRFKYNKFIIISGLLKVTVTRDYQHSTQDDVTLLGPGQEMTVFPGENHSFEALDDCVGLEFYWVELNTTDIVRINHGGMRDIAASE